MKESILVFGATGQQGGATVRALLRRGRNVQAFVRDPTSHVARALADAGVTLVLGDLNDPASVRSAMKGVAGVFSVQTFRGPGGVEEEVRQGMVVATAALEAEVAHLVYSSVGGADRDSGVPHFESKRRVELHIEAVGIPFTILRPVMFHEIFNDLRLQPDEGGGHVLGLWLPPERSVQMIATHDIGCFAADAFDAPQTWIGHRLELAGDELTGNQMADVLQTVSGSPVRYVQLPLEPLRAARPDLASMFDWLNRDGFRADLPRLRATNPALIPLNAWARDHWMAPAVELGRTGARA